MCTLCGLASAGGASQTFGPIFAADPAPRRAAAVNLEAQHGAAASAMPEGVGVKGRRTLIKGGDDRLDGQGGRRLRRRRRADRRFDHR